MEDNTSVGNNLEIRLSGRNEGPTTIVIDESSKLSLYNNGDEPEEQVEDHLVANEEAIKIFMENDGHVERFGKDERYPKREGHPHKK